jgi:hypothetical protein
VARRMLDERLKDHKICHRL